MPNSILLNLYFWYFYQGSCLGCLNGSYAPDTTAALQLHIRLMPRQLANAIFNFRPIYSTIGMKPSMWSIYVHTNSSTYMAGTVIFVMYIHLIGALFTYILAILLKLYSDQHWRSIQQNYIRYIIMIAHFSKTLQQIVYMTPQLYIFIPLSKGREGV